MNKVEMLLNFLCLQKQENHSPITYTLLRDYIFQLIIFNEIISKLEM